MENKNQFNSRRNFLKKGAMITIAGIGASALNNSTLASLIPDDNFTLPPLPYGYNALEPHIDTMTMQIHHDKHHKAYVDKLNEAIRGMELKNPKLEEILTTVSKYPATVRNNGGGHYNHSLFWSLMRPARENNMPEGKLAEVMNASFTNFDEFKKQFSNAATTRFGSGWAWLVKSSDGKLTIGSTPNQDNPLMDISDLKGTPLLALDVWEHAYYLKYQNKRADYINSWWNLVNWDEVSKKI